MARAFLFVIVFCVQSAAVFCDLHPNAADPARAKSVEQICHTNHHHEPEQPCNQHISTLEWLNLGTPSVIAPASDIAVVVTLAVVMAMDANIVDDHSVTPLFWPPPPKAPTALRI
jgi:hypothetical protein